MFLYEVSGGVETSVKYVLDLRKQVMSVPCAKMVIPESHGKAEAFQVGQGEFRRGI